MITFGDRQHLYTYRLQIWRRVRVFRTHILNSTKTGMIFFFSSSLCDTNEIYHLNYSRITIFQSLMPYSCAVYFYN